ncbi:hypothetical protein L2E82_01081 [Cichorium intybus]|uniref:Uncharacterized protein n=1 Tax=Cichorium intybus TaxID=13427 RepID=A0ACB9GYZ5_CICIN|nr:hypothetical protein L2E82_01081 [Cichorium intybus]
MMEGPKWLKPMRFITSKTLITNDFNGDGVGRWFGDEGLEDVKSALQDEVLQFHPQKVSSKRSKRKERIPVTNAAEIIVTELKLLSGFHWQI